MINDDGKFKEWYEENSDAWNKQRRSRYNKDPEYRKLVLERNRKSRAAARKERLQEQKAESAVKMSRVSPRWKEVTVMVDGKPVVFYSIGMIARRLGVSVQAIRLWEHNGTIPPPTNAAAREGKDRLYSTADVERIREILMKTGKLKEPKNADESTTRDRAPLVFQKREVVYKGGKSRLEKLYTVGVLADTVGRTVVTLEHLERRGDLPETPLRGRLVDADGEEQPGRRLYNWPMIKVVQKAFASRPGLIRGRVAWDSFKKEVLAGWEKTGVMGAKLAKVEEDDEG